MVTWPHAGFEVFTPSIHYLYKVQGESQVTI
jgi:hypothetical protein